MAISQKFLILSLLACTGCGGHVAAGPVPGQVIINSDSNSDQLPPAGTVTVPVSAQTIGPNDVFEVRVYNQPDLSSTYRVGPDGTIQFPLVGHIDVRGQSAAQVATKISRALDGDFLLNPQVSVFVKEYNSQKVSVFGEVSKPGTFTYVAGMNVIQALTLAEGYTKEASRKNITVTRTVDNQEIRFEIKVDDIIKGISKNFELRPGDIIYVPQSIF